MAIAKTTAAKIKAAKAAAGTKKVARDADSINISDYKVQGTRTAMRNRMQTDRSRTAGRAANVESKLKKAAAKKPTAMKVSAASHQKDLAKVAGSTAAANKAAAMRKAKNTFGIMDQTGAAKGRAEKRTLKSFK